MQFMNAIRASLPGGFTGIDGDINAYKLIEDTTTAKTHYLRTPKFAHNGGDELYLKLIVKPAGRNYLCIVGMDITSEGTYRLTEFIFLNASDPYCTDLGNGWFQIDISYTSDAAQTQSQWFILLAESGTSLNYDGDGVSGIIFDYCVTDVKPLQACVRNICTNALVPIRSWETAGQFKRDYSELNFNGRSFADCGNGSDVNPSTAVILELLFRTGDRSATDYILYKSLYYRIYLSATGALGCYLRIDGGWQSLTINPWSDNTDANNGLTAYEHILFKYDSTSKVFSAYRGGVKVNEKTLSGLTSYVLDSDNSTLRIAFTHEEKQIKSFSLWKDNEAQKLIDNDFDSWAFNRFRKKSVSKEYIAGIGTGDSFATDNDDWPIQLSKLISSTVIQRGYAGSPLDGAIKTNFITNLTERNYDFVIIQGGVNDVIDDKPANAIADEMIWLITTAQSYGKNVVCVNIGPWKNNTYWNSSRQTVTKTYNTWLASHCLANSIPLADIYAALDTDSNDELDAGYDSGDGLHPNATGAIKIAETIKTAIENT